MLSKIYYLSIKKITLVKTINNIEVHNQSKHLI
jgi:hypothetical protein